MRRLFPHLLNLFLLTLCATLGYSQDGKLSHIDSVRHRLDTAKGTADKIDQLVELAHMTIERSKADEYASQSIELAQLSRDPRLIATTYLRNTDRFLDNPSLSDNLTQATKNLRQAEQVSKENGLEDVLVSVYCDYANVWHFQGSDVKALAYSTQALAVAAGIDSDKAKVKAFCTAGETYMFMNQMLLALRNYLNGLDVAEKSGDHELLRRCYAFLRYLSGSMTSRWIMR
jgi:hypothetical protein